MPSSGRLLPLEFARLDFGWLLNRGNGQVFGRRRRRVPGGRRRQRNGVHPRHRELVFLLLAPLLLLLRHGGRHAACQRSQTLGQTTRVSASPSQQKKNASFTSNLGRTFFESQYNIFTSKDLDGSRIVVITCDAYDSGCLYACKCMQFAMMSCARNFVRVFPGTQLTGFVHVMYLAVSGYTSTCSGAMRAKVKQSMAPSVRLYRHDCNSC
jgi:hypothetical protein